MKTRLTLHQLQLDVHLGWPDVERACQQSILLDITIALSTPPRACFTDELTDTVCYDTLAAKIKQAAERPFRLIEHFAQEIYTLIKNEIHDDCAKISVQITKNPFIKDLQGGVSFMYGET